MDDSLAGAYGRQPVGRIEGVLHHPAVRILLPDAWEVICRDCGDQGGPARELPKDLIALRGPYPSYHQANQAAADHQARAGEAPGA